MRAVAVIMAAIMGMLAFILVATPSEAAPSRAFMHECKQPNNSIEYGWFVEDGYMCINGQIDATTAEAFVLYDVHTVYLNSGGGLLFGSYVTGHMLKESGAKVIIEEGMECVSSCVILLADAVEAEVYGDVGIHFVFGDDGSNVILYDIPLTETYMLHLADGDTALFDAYINWAIQWGFITEQEFLTLDEIPKYRIMEDGNAVTDVNIAWLDAEMLRDFGVIE